MRVALVTQLYPPEFEGGTEAVVRAQARALVRRGHEVRVVAGTDAAHEGRDLEWGRDGLVRVARAPRLPGEAFDLALTRPRLEGTVRAAVAGADVVHVHHWAKLSGGLVRALACDLPVVVTLHDAFAACPRFFRAPPDDGRACPEGAELEPCVRCLAPDLPGLAAADLAARVSARREAFDAELAAAAALLAPSRFLSGRLEVALGLEPGRVLVVPHGLLRELPPRRGAHGTPWDGKGPLRVMHFGHLSRGKGILDLVRALAALPRGAVELDLLGGALEDGLREAVNECAGALAVRLHGSFDGARLARVAASAHLAAFPSRLEESYGLVLDEAAALGLPLWVSDRGALPERLASLGGGGRVLPAAAPSVWARAFESLLARPDDLATERAHLRVPPGPAAAADRLEVVYGGLCRARA